MPVSSSGLFQDFLNEAQRESVPVFKEALGPIESRERRQHPYCPLARVSVVTEKGKQNVAMYIEIPESVQAVRAQNWC